MMMKAIVLLIAGAGRAALAMFPTLYMPLDLRYGDGTKVTTALSPPGTDYTIDVCYDLGSSDFFVFRPDAIQNWGRNCLACQGLCNRTVPATGVYDPSKSSSASGVEPLQTDHVYGYGSGLAKAYRANGLVNDTFIFSNQANYATKVENVQVALAYYLQQRVLDAGGKCDPVPTYDYSIMGMSPWYYSNDPSKVEKTFGPSFRHNLLLQGLVSNTVQSMWFEKAPPKITDPYTGSGLLGGLDLSKFTGPLVKVPSINATTIAYSAVGYYTVPPNLTFVADKADVDVPIDRSERTGSSSCVIDSGAVADGFLPKDWDGFLKTTGLKYNPKRPNPGQYLSWPAPCDDMPTDGDKAFLRYGFAGVDAAEKVEIHMPLRAYARNQLPEDTELGWCTMNIYLGSCLLGSPFATRMFFAADDDRLELALAQGAVAESGSGVDFEKVVDSIPRPSPS